MVNLSIDRVRNIAHAFSNYILITKTKKSMKLNDEELEYLEGICMNDERYLNWIGSYNEFARDYDVPHSAVIWLESTMLVMLLGSVNIDKRFVFKTWNNGKSNEESYLVKETTLSLLENGDKEFFHIAEKTISWLKQDTDDYIFYGRLKKKRKKGGYKALINDCGEERYIVMVADAAPMYFSKNPSFTDIERHIRRIIDICPKETWFVVAMMNLVSYYNTVTNNRLKHEYDTLSKIFIKMGTEESLYPDVECPFSEEQVKKSGISKEAKIVLAVMNYMFNGDFRQKYKTEGTALDFSVAMFSVLYVEGYWEKHYRDDFVKMMNEFFDVNIKIKSMNKWIERTDIDYRNWEKSNKQKIRKDIAEKFLEMIKEVKKRKINN